MSISNQSNSQSKLHWKQDFGKYSWLSRSISSFSRILGKVYELFRSCASDLVIARLTMHHGTFLGNANKKPVIHCPKQSKSPKTVPWCIAKNNPNPQKQSRDALPWSNRWYTSLFFDISVYSWGLIRFPVIVKSPEIKSRKPKGFRQTFAK